MEFGIFLHVHWPFEKNQKQVYQEILHQVLTAEKLGFKSVWIAEHHFTRYGICPSPIQLASFLAAQTKTIRFGIGVALLPFYHPVRLAEDVALLDLLSKGRLDLGVGRGLIGTFEQIAMTVSKRANEGRFREMLDLLPHLWMQPDKKWRGSYYKLPPIDLGIKTAQKPHPPIYIGISRSEKRIKEAVERGWQIITGVTMEYERHLWVRKRYNELANQMNMKSDSSESPFLFYVHVAKSKQQAENIPYESVNWINTLNQFRAIYSKKSDIAYDNKEIIALIKKPARSFEYTLKNLAFFGTPKEVRCRIEELKYKHQVKKFVCDFNMGKMKHEDVMQSMKLFAKTIIPYLSK